jgi:heme/copper-type cytochrome/quinol oxidase subunit 2
MAAYGVRRLNKAFGKKRRSTILWEAVALVALVITVAHLALPMLDDIFLKREQREIVIRAYIKEGGGFTPNVIKLKRGERVKLVIMSMDVTHSMVIPDLNIDSGLINPGYRKVIEIYVNKPGTYEFYCGTLCSPQHPFMKGKLVVE